MSPLFIAFIVLAAGAAGAVLLTGLYDAGEGSFKPEKLQVGTAHCSDLRMKCTDCMYCTVVE